jgi:hypothetical protein
MLQGEVRSSIFGGLALGGSSQLVQAARGEHRAAPYVHPTGIFPQARNEFLLATITEGPAVSNDLPPYAAKYRVHPST